MLEINETSEIFWLNNCKQHSKISKTFNYPVRIYRTCPKWPSFEPVHFFQAHGEIQQLRVCKPKMFNLVYNVGCIPSEWKTSNVVPIHKKDDKSDIKNYRPISLISLVMKVFERIMYEELLNRTENKIDPRQHGFLKNKSCNTNLLSFTNSVALSLHDKVGVDVVYFDFAKAFDTVWHDLILNKLKNQYNIDGNLLKFFVNYLQGRKQLVILDNCSSDSTDVLSGVPQGSILGPLLFLLFINDKYIGINEDTNIGLYADDTKMWRTIYSEHDCALLQKDIDIYLCLFAITYYLYLWGAA